MASAIRRPHVIAHWYVKTMDPLTHLGEASAWYNGTIAERIPTESPETPLPAHKSPTSVAETWRMLPMLKMIARDTMMDSFRPYLSGIIGATRAPKKVPNSNIAVIRALSWVLNSPFCSGIWAFTYCISKISLMSPVS